MKYLWVGDPHARVRDLDDCKALAFLIIEKAKENCDGDGLPTVILAGDLYDTHAIIHAEVQWFWWVFLQQLREAFISCIVLEGNHDRPGTEGSLATALIAHVEQATVVTHRPIVKNGILFCPYTAKPDQLVEWSKTHPECNTLFCHQTFDGSKYENGFFAGDGVDPNLIVQKHVISGHIHAPQEFGKIWYPGAPRWQTLSDANVDRAIWLLEFDAAGNLMNKTPFDTSTVCRKIFHFVDTPSEPVSFTPVANADYRVDIKGPQSWIEERRPKFENIASVRAIRTDGRNEVKVRESEGIAVAFNKFTDSFEPRHKTPTQTLKTMAEERLRGIF